MPAMDKQNGIFWLTQPITRPGGLARTDPIADRQGVFTDAYAVNSKRAFSRNIVNSFLRRSGRKNRLWVLSRPLSGFCRTFSNTFMEVQPGGGSQETRLDPDAEGVLFVVEGGVDADHRGEVHEFGHPRLCVPATWNKDWSVLNSGTDCSAVPWVRQAYEYVEGIDVPPPFVTREQDVAPLPMPKQKCTWANNPLVEP